MTPIAMALLQLTGVFILLLGPIPTGARIVQVQTSFQPFNQTWEAFKIKFNRFYSEEEEARRFEAFVDNLKEIERHNQDFLDNKKSFTMGINQFTDQMKDQVMYSCDVLEDEDKVRPAHHRRKRQSFSGFCKPYTIPTSDQGTREAEAVDWKKQGVVTRVSDQGQCGSCYSYGVTTTIAAQMKMKMGGHLVELSMQQLVDCSTKSCSGSSAEKSFGYINAAGGLMAFKDYPSRQETFKEGRPGSCQFNKNKVAARVKGCWYGWDETMLKHMVNSVGPVYVSVTVPPSFQKYTSGVYSVSDCSGSGHCLTVIGYGKDPRSSKNYWIVKNSWGTNWGMEGYGWIERGNNMCNIGRRITVPIVETSRIKESSVKSSATKTRMDTRFLSIIVSAAILALCFVVQ